jgi:hypothetical protein
MVKKRTAIISIFFLGISIIIGLIINRSLNLFFSFLLIGFWILFTIKFFEKRKKLREYNSPQNTSFFLFGPISIGLFYTYWSVYNAILNWNVLEDFNIDLYLSPWIIIFALPYLIYTLFLIRACFKKFDVVYLFKSTSISSRKFGLFYIFFILFVIFSSWIFYYDIIGALRIVIIPINQIHYFTNLMLWIVVLFSGLFFIVYGIIGKRQSIPRLSPEYIARRRNGVNRISSAPVRRLSHGQSSQTSTRSTPRRSRTTSVSRSAPQRSSSKKVSNPSHARSKPKTKTTASKSRVNFEKHKPKAGILSLEDFKCIFCFNLPQINDRRGIILCPNCKHPAHEDEFKNWMKNSILCSRCSATIPLRFRQNPEIIPIRKYVEVIEEFKRRK